MGAGCPCCTWTSACFDCPEALAECGVLHFYGGLGGVYSPPKPHAHVAFYFDYLESPLRSPQMPHRALKALSGINYSLKASSRLSPLLRACLSDSA